jgi:hypothetical protein
MEEANNKKMVPDIKDEGKGKRKWGSLIYNFLASGGLILVLVGGFIVAVIIISKLS